MEQIQEILRARLSRRSAENAFRTLKTSTGGIDFSSNDYLGFARSDFLKKRWLHRLESVEQMGAGGSRLLTGNSALAETLEQSIATFHRAEAGLLFNSGYDANLGLLACIASRKDTILFDRLVHASIREGIQLSPATSYGFAHNDLRDLEKKLQKAVGQVFIVLESVYSMDGDLAPLKAISELAHQYQAALIVDEAHATGVYGPGGEGQVVALGLEKKIFARIHTFGKALGNQGAIVLGSEALRHYLINFSRAFIYTTALPYYTLLAIQEAYEYLKADAKGIVRLRANIQQFRSLLSPMVRQHSLDTDSAIQIIVLPGNARVKSLATYLQSKALDIRPILSPTVPKGRERIRICLHAFNTDHEIRLLTDDLNQYWSNENISSDE